MNAFESGRRKAIPAVLVYPRCGGQWLMMHRTGKKPGDVHQGKWNGLGGKCEADESPLETARRETMEEAGMELPAASFKALGVLQFPNFKPSKSEDWIVFVFSVETPESALKLDFSCPEGELHWTAKDQVLKLPLWAGDQHFLPLVLAGKSFMGTFWYQNGQVDRHWLEVL